MNRAHPLKQLLPSGSIVDFDIRFDINVASRASSTPNYECLLKLKTDSGEERSFVLDVSILSDLNNMLNDIVVTFPKCRRYR
ncbi:hypothetical protein M3Y97_00249000 [Aphelenchoides bicaudatus]|nr:hypothetical protein M3Y97_00249000 [Aphelenchoides bicaudatus]